MKTLGVIIVLLGAALAAVSQQEYVPFANDPGEAQVGDKSFADELKCFILGSTGRLDTYEFNVRREIA